MRALLIKAREIPKAAVLVLLRAYQFAISPLFPAACRYVPTCSEYAAEAIDRHGVLRGSAMAIWRLLRCHPFVKGGFDPVPIHDHVAADAFARGERALARVHDGNSH